MSEICFDDFNYDIVVCPICGTQNNFCELCECENKSKLKKITKKKLLKKIKKEKLEENGFYW